MTSGFDSGFFLAPQIRAFYQFHVYFTIRRILYQLGGIQNMSVLPGDPTFNQFNNHYDTPSYKRIYPPSLELIHQAIFALHTAKKRPWLRIRLCTRRVKN